MDELIRQIYGGFDQFPADMVGVDAPKYIDAREMCYLRYEEFKAKLPLEMVEELNELMESQLEMVAAGMEEGFTDGFKMGARLMIEILAE